MSTPFDLLNGRNKLESEEDKDDPNSLGEFESSLSSDHAAGLFQESQLVGEGNDIEDCKSNNDGDDMLDDISVGSFPSDDNTNVS